jgi:hypothetical protein
VALSAQLARRLRHVESAPAATMGAIPARGPQPRAALMRGTTKYVGLDVHQATTAASVREASGRVARAGYPSSHPENGKGTSI